MQQCLLSRVYLFKMFSFFNIEQSNNFSTIFKTFDTDSNPNKSLEFREFLLALSPPNQLNFKDHITLLIDMYRLYNYS